MSVLYVREQGAKVTKSGGRIQVTKNGVVAAEALLANLERIVLMGGGEVSTPATKALLEAGVSVVYASPYGKVFGMLSECGGEHPDILMAQTDRVRDAEYSLQFARRVVHAKITGQLRLLEKYGYNHGREVVGGAINQLRLARQELDKMNKTEGVRGIEGWAAAAYFSAFGECLRTNEVVFNGRNRRPPRDPVNSLLSFGYTLLLSDVSMALQTAGLHPGIGFLHTVYHRRPALALDVMEVLRPAIVDRLVLKLFNKRIFSPDDFVVSEEGVLLHSVSQKKFITAYEEAMNNDLKFVFYQDISTRKWLAKESMKLKKCIMESEVWEAGLAS